MSARLYVIFVAKIFATDAVSSALQYPVARSFDPLDRGQSEPRLCITPEVDAGRPIRCGVINNPLSFRNTRGALLAAIRDLVRARPSTPYHEVHRPEDIVAATHALVDGGCELLAINGGDGTVQAVLTGLFGRGTPESLPLLAVMPGGTTNMVAADIGTAQQTVPALQRVLGGAQAGRVRGTAIWRPVMRAAITPEAEPIYSMFFGTGAIYHGIKFCRQYVARVGLRGEIGPGLALAVFLAKIAFGHGGSMVPPLHLSGRLDGRPLQTGAYLGMLVSTVSRQFLGLRPFWGREPAPLQYTAVSYWPEHLWRAVPAVLRGRPNRFVRPEYGYTSHNAWDLELHLDCGFTLDGELFTPRPGTAVTLHGGATAAFLRQPPA